MGEVVNYVLRCFLVVGTLVLGSFPGALAAQSRGWGEPIAPPEDPAPTPRPEAESPPRPQPQPAVPTTSGATNPDWADAPPTDFEARSPDNPDWVEETEPPPVGKLKQRASEHYDLRYANRDLTLPRGMMRGTFDTVVGRRVEEPIGGSSEPFGPVGTVSTMSFGVAISLVDGFEIGFSRYRMGSFPSLSVYPGFGFGGEGLVAFSLSPDVKFGDIPLYGRFEALDRETVKLAFDAVFRIPSRTTFGFLLGVPMRFIIDERFAFDTGAEMVVDDNPQGPSVWSMNIPFSFVANATDQLFFELMSGMTFFDLSQTIRTATSGLVQGPFYLIPLGVEAGYTFEARATMMDVFVDFRFPGLYGFTTRSNEVNAETWQVTIGFNVYSPILFKGSAL